MNTIIDKTSDALVRRLRLEREGRGWSQAEVAERSGVSKAAVSKIERGEMSPTANVLVRLAGAFDLTLAGLLVRAESGGERLVRRGDQSVWRDPETGYTRRQVFARPDHPVEIASVELPAGRSVALPASSYALIRQVVHVRCGRLVVDEDGERTELLAGDSLAFGPPSEVVFSNETDETCEYEVVISRR